MAELPDSGGLLLTGRLSAQEQPWLADHRVLGSILLPGTAFLELAFSAGDRLGCDRLDELTLEAPLILPDRGGAWLRVAVGPADEAGRHPVTVHSRPEGERADEPFVGEWTRHATGVLATAGRDDAGELPGVPSWPPADAVAVDVSGLYEALAEAGYGYGPAFQGLRAAWRKDGEVFAEVVLADEQQPESGRFGLHPALLDAALHAAGLGGFFPDGRPRLPFAWSDVRLAAVGAAELRVRLSLTGPDAIAIAAADVAGAPVASIGSLALRQLDPSRLAADTDQREEFLLELEWTAVEPAQPLPAGRWAIVGTDYLGLGAELADAGIELISCPDTDSLRSMMAAEQPAPEIVLVTLGSASGARGGPAESGRDAAHRALGLVQEWLDDPRFAASRLVAVTRGAVAAGLGDPVDPGQSPVWGLLRSAQSEHPGRFVLVDLDGLAASSRVIPAALAIGESQLAVRDGVAHALRFARASDRGLLSPPGDAATWRLGITDPGTLENIGLLPCPEALHPLGPGEVRVAMRAAGLNFRDILVALGMYPGKATMGSEGAGVVTEVGPGTVGLAPGDRVMGLFDGAFGPIAVTDCRLLVRVPENWSFAQAAAVPIVFLTAYYGLIDLADLQPGESLLLHAAAGGVGMAAHQLARHLGGHVFATASPGKWPAVRAAGLDEAHIASSRTLEFEQRFLAATGGQGVDVVLNALARDFVDASLRTMPRGGRFIEMGKTDIRKPDEVAARYPGVRYTAFDLSEAGPERIQQMLNEIVRLFERGALRHLPVTSVDVRRAGDAFRYLSQARHIGKLVLTLPARLDPAGTVLITGGTGTLGGLVARHLAAGHGARHLLLASRQGSDSAAAASLASELTGMGAQVTIAACDVADRGAVEALLASIPREHPLTAVVHTAGVVDDGTVDSLTPQQLDRVLRPKLAGAWNLHELTQHEDLSAFVLFSSAAGVTGAAGQANYAAANAFLDSLAACRCRSGLPAISVAWGLWEPRSGISGHLDEAGLRRIARSGILPLPADAGLRLFDAALASDQALVVAARLDLGAWCRRPGGRPRPVSPAWFRWRSAWLPGRPRNGIRQCSTLSAATSPQCWGTAPRRRSTPTEDSSMSASTR